MMIVRDKSKISLGSQEDQEQRESIDEKRKVKKTPLFCTVPLYLMYKEMTVLSRILTTRRKIAVCKLLASHIENLRKNYIKKGLH